MSSPLHLPQEYATRIFILSRTIIFILLCLPSLQAASAPLAEPPPLWVKEIDIPLEPIHIDGSSATQAGSRYLLLDDQTDIETETRYRRRTILIENVNGAENQGRQTFDFQPSYHTLIFHRFDIIRDGRRIDQLDLEKIKTLQRESDLNRHLYDETMTALIIAEDIRPGDIVDYAYSLRGANPVLKGKFIGSFSLGYSVPVEQIHCSIRSPKGLGYQKRTYGQVPPSIQSTDSNGFTTESWEAMNPNPIFWEDGTPSWHDPYPKICISEFSTWSEVVDWALPLYENATQGQSEVCREPDLPEAYRNQNNDPLIRARAAIEFVQDDIRYFGIETGPNSLQPHDVRQVFKQRFGDCKDKSSLLVCLLRGIGIKAYPVIVNSYQIRNPEENLPSPFLFNHVVVMAHFPSLGRKLIDPTISHQRGPIPSRFQPSYGWGLPIRGGVESLVELPRSDSQSYALAIREEFSLSQLNGPLDLKISSEYANGYADSQRRSFKSSRAEELERSFHEYYGNYYNALEISNPPSIEDEPSTNRIKTIKKYRISAPWSYINNDTRNFYLESPLIKSALQFPSTKDRAMPLRLTHPLRIEKTVTCEMPRNWEVETSQKTIDNPFFILKRSVHSEGKEISLTYLYESKADFVSAAAFSRYLSDANDAWDLLSFNIEEDISIPGPALDSRKASSKLELFFSLFFAVLAARLAFAPISNRFTRKATPITVGNLSGKIIRASLCIASLSAFALFLIEAHRAIVGHWETYGYLGSTERFAVLLSLFQRLFFMIWALMLVRGFSALNKASILARKLLFWNVGFLLFWLIVRSGIQQVPFGYSHLMLAEIALSFALLAIVSIALLRRNPAS